jgi:hypothetical protein
VYEGLLGQLYSVKAGIVNGADSTRAGESPQEGGGPAPYECTEGDRLKRMPGFDCMGQTLYRMVEKLRISQHRATHMPQIRRSAGWSETQMRPLITSVGAVVACLLTIN